MPLPQCEKASSLGKTGTKRNRSATDTNVPAQHGQSNNKAEYCSLEDFDEAFSSLKVCLTWTLDDFRGCNGTRGGSNEAEMIDLARDLHEAFTKNEQRLFKKDALIDWRKKLRAAKKARNKRRNRNLEAVSAKVQLVIIMMASMQHLLICSSSCS
jgi:hypothetical protein